MFCSSAGLHRISFVRASENSFRTVVDDAPEGNRDGCLLGEPTRRRPVLPRTAPPLRRAPPRPVVFLGFGFDRWTKYQPVIVFKANRGTILNCVYNYIFPEMPCMKNAYKDKQHRSTAQHPGAKSARIPYDKPLVNISSTAHCAPRSCLCSCLRNTSRTLALGATGGVEGAAIYGGSLFAWKQRREPRANIACLKVVFNQKTMIEFNLCNHPFEDQC